MTTIGKREPARSLFIGITTWHHALTLNFPKKKIQTSPKGEVAPVAPASAHICIMFMWHWPRRSVTSPLGEVEMP